MATPPWPVCSTRPRDSPRWHAARWWSWDASGAVGASGIAPCNCWPLGILSGPRSWRRTMGARSFVARLDAFSKFQSQHVTIQTKVLRQALSSARRSRTSWRCSAERSLRRRLQGDLPYQPCHHRQPPIAALTHIAFDARRVVDQPLRLSQNRGRGCHLARRLRHKLLFRSQLPIETYVGVRPWMRSHRVLAPGGDHQPDPMIMLTVPAARPVNGHLDLPTGGHGNSPRTVAGCPRGRPLGVPRDGHGNSPRAASFSVGFRPGAPLLCRRGRRRGGRIRRQ